MINLSAYFRTGRNSLGYLGELSAKLILLIAFFGGSWQCAAQDAAVCRPQTTTDPAELYLNEVKFSGAQTPDIINTSTYSAEEPFGYQDFTMAGQWAKQYPGGQITVTVKGNHDSHIKMWMDWNKSGHFEEPLELIGDTEGQSGVTTFVIDVPQATPAGKYRIRIRNNYAVYFEDGVRTANISYSSSFSPCETFGSGLDSYGNGWKYYGEAEDYFIEVVPSPECFAPVITTATDITHLTADLNWTASGRGASPLSYELEWNDTGIFDGSSAVNGITDTSYPVSDLHSGSTYYYRVRTNCGSESGLSGWSETESFMAGGYTPLSIGGFNEDVIAGGFSSAISATTSPVDTYIGYSNKNVWAQKGAFLNGYEITEGLPQSRILKNADGTETPAEIKYYLNDYSFPNSLRISDTGTQSVLSLDKPVSLSTLYLAATGSNGQPVLNIEVVYDSGDSQQFSNITLNDWSGSFDYISKPGSTIKRNDYSSPDYDPDGPRIYQLTLSGLDEDRKINEIIISSTNSTYKNNIANFYAVSAALAAPKVLSVHSESFCGDEEPAISATAEADIKWYLQETGGTPVKTTVSGEVWNPDITGETTFWAEADNGIVHGKRVPITVSASDTEFIAENGDWNTAANWTTNTVPTADSCVKIQAGKTVFLDTADAAAKTLTVENGAKLTLNSGSALTVTDYISNAEENRDNFIVENLANLIQINDDADNEGEITLKKKFTFSTERKQYNFVVSPLEDMNLKNIYPGTTYALRYNESTNYFVATDGSYIPGRGLALKEGTTGNGDAVFYGKPFNGELDYQVYRTNEGYNLVGNPYPSNLKLKSLYLANQDVMSTDIWFWDNRNNTVFDQQGSGYVNTQYAILNAYNETGVPAPNTPQTGEDSKKPNGIANAGSAFLIRATSTGQIHFDNSMRVKDFGPEFYGKGDQTNAETDRYWLTVTSPSDIQAMTAIVYFEGGKDEYWLDDSDTLGNSDDIFTMAEGHQVIIQGREPFRSYDTVPLGYRAYETGTYIISVHSTEGVFANGQKIYLVDKLLNVTADLTEKVYKFQTRSGEFEDRFLIKYSKNSLYSDPVSISNEVQFTKNENQILIHSTLDKITDVEVFNLTGRPVYSKSDINSNDHTVSLLTFGKQIVVVAVKTETGETISRKFIIK